MNPRKMRIGMSIRGHGYHPAAWRHPDVPADGTLQVEHYVRSANKPLARITRGGGAGCVRTHTPSPRNEYSAFAVLPTLILPSSEMGKTPPMALRP